MAVDVTDFDSIEDLDIEFKKRLRKAPDEEAEAVVRNEWQEGKASFWQHQSLKATLAVARRDALDKYPLAKEFADDIKGSSAAEIEASAKRFHERVESLTKAAEAARQETAQTEAQIRQQAQQQYGSPAAGGGGSVARPSNDLSPADEAIARVHTKLARGEGLQRSGDRMDAIVMANERLRQAIEFQRVPHPELNLGTGGSYRGELAQDRRLVDARVEGRRKASERK